MTSSRRLPVYILHDGSEASIRGIDGSVQRLRCEPWALEVVWLSCISLSGKAKQTFALSEISAIGNFGDAGADMGALDVAGGLSVFDSDANANLRKGTAASKGDWRPFLVLILGADPDDGLGEGLDVIKQLRCSRRLAFVASTVTPLSRSLLTDGGFELIDIAGDMAVPMSDADSVFSWSELLSRAIACFPHHGVAAVALEPQRRPIVFADKDAAVGPGGVAVGAPNPSVEGEVTRPKVAELKLSNLLTAGLGNLSTDGRLTRRGFLVHFVFCLVLVAVFVRISSPHVGLSFGLLAIGFWIFLSGVIRRTHDVGLSGWFILVPFYNVWLLFAPGQSADNKYGRNPRVR